MEVEPSVIVAIRVRPELPTKPSTKPPTNLLFS